VLTHHCYIQETINNLTTTTTKLHTARRGTDTDLLYGVWTLGKVCEDLSLEVTAAVVHCRKDAMKTRIRIQNI